jgi:carbamoyl-phosphate synthase large subunit
MGIDTDFARAFMKSWLASGGRVPTKGTAFLSVRDADKNALVPVAAALAGLGFELVATAGTADALRSAGLDVDEIEKGKPVVDMIRKRRFDLVVNTPEGGNARSDGYAIREAALATRIPCITTPSGAAMAVHAIASARREEALSLQERIEVEAVGVV